MKLALALTLLLPAAATAAQDTLDYSKDGIEFKIPKDGDKNVLRTKDFLWVKDWPDTLAEFTMGKDIGGRLYFWKNTNKIAAEEYIQWRLKNWLKDYPGSQKIHQCKDGDKALLQCTVKTADTTWRYVHCAFVAGDKVYDLMLWGPKETFGAHHDEAYHIVNSVKFGGGGEKPVDAPTDMSQFVDKPIGSSFTFRLTGGASGSVWGTDVYTMDSNVATAAAHAGVLKAGEAGVVTVTIVAGREKYVGSTRNGVTTSDWGSWDRSFKFGK